MNDRHTNTRIKIYSVSELNSMLRKNLEDNFSNIWIEGEISNFYFHNRKHMYFDLKDEFSKIKVAMFYQCNKNLIFKLEEGLHVLINGYISLYEKRGEYQFIALDVKPVGKGALILAFEQLKQKLEKKGYFDISHKRALPVIPKKIGIVTSTGGAVLKDMVSVIRKKFKNFHLVIRNVNVQGATSSTEICEAMGDLCQYGVDVVILARGGGSLEDLWAFNTEEVADKIFYCPAPVISAIGHETDFTISDFVADRRASTPSVAGDMVIMDKLEAVQKIKFLYKSIKNSTISRIDSYSKELNLLINRRIFRRPLLLLNSFNQVSFDLWEKLKRLAKDKIAEKEKYLSKIKVIPQKEYLMKKIYEEKILLNSLRINLISDFKDFLSKKNDILQNLLKNLEINNPASILKKGFAIIYESKKDIILRKLEDIELGKTIRVLMAEGIVAAKVLEKIYHRAKEKNGD